MGILNGLVGSYRAWKQRQADREKEWLAQMQNGFSYIDLKHLDNNTLFVSTAPPAFRSWHGALFNFMMIDLVYALLKERYVFAKSFTDIDLSQFDAIFELLETNGTGDTCLIGPDKKKEIVLTNDFNKLLVGSLVLESYAMEYDDSVKLFVIEKEIFDQLKSGTLTAEECIEQDNYDFYIGSGADHCYFTVYRPSHEYGDIVETIKEVMAPYGLAVNYAETEPEKENGEGEK